MNRKNLLCTLNIWDAGVPPIRVPKSLTGQRLLRGFCRLQNIQLVRNHRRDPLYGKSAEERIIWRELLDLEVQAVDEEIDRMAAAVGEPVAQT